MLHAGALSLVTYLLGVPSPTLEPQGGGLPMILLSSIVWVPTIGALVLLLFPERNDHDRSRVRNTAIGVSLIPLVLALAAWAQFSLFQTPFQYVENQPWIKSLGIRYHLGLDGLSLPFLLLSTLLFCVAALASHEKQRVKAYFILLLLMESGVNGLFVAVDYFLFFLFWEMELIPMFFLIALWGGPRRLAAAWRFLLFTLSGSALMLLAIVLLYAKAGLNTFDMLALQQARLASPLATVLFLLFLANFAIKLPAVPLHTWLLEAQAEAPAPIAALLTGIVLKTGGYGLLRINLAGFPTVARQLSWLLVALAVAGVLWGSLAALVQDDLKRMVGYSSVASMGLVLLAASTRSAIALNGAVLQLFAHGLVVALLILLIGAVEERTRTRSLRALGGLAARTPQLAIVWLIGVLAALGVPGLVNFIAQFQIFVGSYPEQHLATALCLLGLVLGTGYLLSGVRRTFFGPIKEAFLRLRDLEPLETTWASTLLVPIFALGLFPQLLVERIGAGVSDVAIRLGHG